MDSWFKYVTYFAIKHLNNLTSTDLHVEHYNFLVNILGFHIDLYTKIASNWNTFSNETGRRNKERLSKPIVQIEVHSDIQAIIVCRIC